MKKIVKKFCSIFIMLNIGHLKIWEEGKTFNLDSLLKANENEEKKSLNRRVEFLIFYKR